MENLKKEYENKRESIKNQEGISELERSNRYFGNWIDYVFNSVDDREKNSLKYESEKLRIHI
jgi:hypothetical protein